MLAVAIDKFGGPEVLKLAEVPTPDPGPGEVLIRVACAGVNPADWKDCEGRVAIYFTPVFPYVLGFDGAGVVTKVGPGVANLRAGDRVTTCSNHGQGQAGTYAEYVIAGEDRCGRLPDKLTYAQGAAIPVPGLSAWQGLFDKGGLKAGQKVVIHGASGGIGSWGLQFAKSAGARVAGTCSTPNVSYVEGLGADRAIDYRQEDIVKAVRAWAPGGVDLVFDAVGQKTLPKALDMLRPGGILVAIVTLLDDFAELEADVKAAASRGFTHVIHVMADVGAAGQLSEIAILIEQGTVRVPPIQVFDLKDVAKAHDLMRTGHVRGKLVLKVAEL